jgi:carbamoyl-phosphate synthase large subunit
MNKEIDLVINTTSGEQDILDSFSIRRTTLINKVVYFTTIRGADAMIKSLKFLKENKSLNVVALQAR